MQETQQADQMLAASKQLAALVRAHYLNLREEGFNALEAIHLATALQTSILSSNGNQGK
jgi:hypothetical protein